MDTKDTFEPFSIYKVPQRRWKCPHCQQAGWATGREQVPPEADHDRADGRQCLQAKNTYRLGYRAALMERP